MVAPNSIRYMLVVGEKLTNANVDERIAQRLIKRLQCIINAKAPIQFQCLIEGCSHIWLASPDKILNGKTGCPKCAKNIKLTNSSIDAVLLINNIVRIGEYINANSPLGFRCLTCWHEWKARAHGPIVSGSGCAKCAGKLKLTNDFIDKKLDGSNIRRIGTYINMKTPMLLECLCCLHQWLSRPYNTIYNERGCPKCRLGKNEKLIGDLLELNGVSFERQKLIKELNISESKNIRVDYYIRNSNTIVEYNGIQHYQTVKFFHHNDINLEKQQHRDEYLKDFCSTNNINLIVIDGRVYKNNKLRNYTVNTLIPQLKQNDCTRK